MNVQTAVGQPKLRFKWIVGQRWDLGWFFLPILLAAACFAAADLGNPSKSYFILPLLFLPFMLSWFHTGASWFHYLDSRNRKYYLSNRKNVLIFLAAPPLVFLASVFLVMKVTWLGALIYMGWSLQHLVKQNTGILLLYHNHHCGEAVVERTLEMNTQYAWSTFFALLFVERVLLPVSLPLAHQIFLGVSLVFLLWALKSSTAYLFDLRKQIKSGSYLNVPAFLFWLVSVFWFAPLAFLGHSYVDAVLIPNIIHWCQYIGLNYLLTRRKYATAETSEFLPLRRPVIVYMLTGFAFIGIAAGAAHMSNPAQPQETLNLLAVGILQGLSNVHYFQDAFLWRFREAHNRSAILQYLKVVQKTPEAVPAAVP